MSQTDLEPDTETAFWVWTCFMFLAGFLVGAICVGLAMPVSHP